MLKIFRKKKVTKTVLWGLVILIVPAFVLWGSGSFRGEKRKGPKYVGIVDGKKISFEELFENMTGVRSQLILNYWNQRGILNGVLRNRVLLSKLAWERLLMLKEAKRNRIKARDDEVVNYIRSHPLFIRGGKFDDKVYEYLLRHNFSLGPRNFEEIARENLAIDKLRRSLTEGVEVSNAEVLEEYKKVNEKVRIGYTLVEAKDFYNNVSIEDEEMRNYYSKHRSEFIMDERVNVLYVAFNYSDYESEIGAMSAAKEFVSAMMREGSQFEQAAKERGFAVKETGFFAWGSQIHDIGFVKEFQRTSFILDVGDTSGVIMPADPSIGKCFIINVKETSPRHEADFYEVRNEIRDVLAEEAAGRLCLRRAEEIHAKIDKLAADGNTLQMACSNMNLNYSQTTLFSRYEPIEGLGMAINLKTAAFKLKIGDLSVPVEIETGFCIFTPLEFKRIEEGQFQKDREEFAKKVLAKKKNLFLDEWFSAVTSRTKMNIDLRKIEKYY